MKSIAVLGSINKYKEQSAMDLMTVQIEYDDGHIGTASIYRAELNRIEYQLKLVKKYGIPYGELSKFVDLCSGQFKANHFYDED